MADELQTGMAFCFIVRRHLCATYDTCDLQNSFFAVIRVQIMSILIGYLYFTQDLTVRKRV